MKILLYNAIGFAILLAYAFLLALYMQDPIGSGVLLIMLIPTMILSSITVVIIQKGALDDFKNNNPNYQKLFIKNSLLYILIFYIWMFLIALSVGNVEKLNIDTIMSILYLIIIPTTAISLIWSAFFVSAVKRKLK